MSLTIHRCRWEILWHHEPLAHISEYVSTKKCAWPLSRVRLAQNPRQSPFLGLWSRLYRPWDRTRALPKSRKNSPDRPGSPKCGACTHSHSLSSSLWAPPAYNTATWNSSCPLWSPLSVDPSIREVRQECWEIDLPRERSRHVEIWWSRQTHNLHYRRIYQPRYLGRLGSQGLFRRGSSGQQSWFLQWWAIQRWVYPGLRSRQLLPPR